MAILAPMNRTLRFAAAALLLIFLAACGAKGPLFLPKEEPAEEQVEPATDAPAEDATPPTAPEATTPPVTPPPATP